LASNQGPYRQLLGVEMGRVFDTDVLIVGSGIAGLTAALHLSEGLDVTIITKAEPWKTCTNRAQGGIAAALSKDDSPEQHLRDTIDAGAGLCHEDLVRECLSDGPELIHWLETLGVDFAKKTDGSLDLGREGGHRSRRVVHVQDRTGAAVEERMLAAASNRPGLKMFDSWIGVDLITSRHLGHGGKDRCLGCYAMDMSTGEISTIRAKTTILATGGSGKVYLYTTNPDVATGDGVAMAWRAGARIANMEFYQFHPTCLYHPMGNSFLISEAVRGEGGRLILKDGQHFMDKYHEMKELAPRDVVARAIDTELKRTGDESVFLDVSHLSGDFIEARFPTIFNHCMSLGLDMRKEPIPVVPAAHYQCGGVLTDLNGCTTITGLYAIGEVASTGFHGANRLASNSLLEGLVFGRNAAAAVSKALVTSSDNSWQAEIPKWNIGLARDPEEAVAISQNWHEIRRFMWNYLGLVRSDMRLQRARRRLSLVREEIYTDYWSFILTPSLVELRNLADVAYLVLEMANMRKESRGLHFNIDYPEVDDEYFCRDTVLRRVPGRGFQR
jgi:L-aspartate oxidase